MAQKQFFYSLFFVRVCIADLYMMFKPETISQKPYPETMPEKYDHIPLNIPLIAASSTPIMPHMPPSTETTIEAAEHGLHIDESALERLAALQLQKQDRTLKLRIRIRGGGCSGFQYKFVLTNEIKPDDIVCGSKTCQFLVDPLSMGMLRGATLVYEITPMESGFVLHNPQAQSACGCGASFALKS